MVLKMEEKELIRRLVNIQGMSQREVNRRFGWLRDSIADAIRDLEPNTYTLRSPRARPMTDPVVPLVKQWLEMTNRNLVNNDTPRRESSSACATSMALKVLDGSYRATQSLLGRNPPLW